MMMWSFLQGGVEYGTLSGGAAGAPPRGPGGHSLLAWATQHSALLLAVVAAVLLLGLLRGARRR